jgi:hypothetical protein
VKKRGRPAALGPGLEARLRSAAGQRRRLCSQPTCSRMENLPDEKTVIRLGEVLVDLWLSSYDANDGSHCRRFLQVDRQAKESFATFVAFTIHISAGSLS